jgi:hypothetical protein
MLLRCLAPALLLLLASVDAPRGGADAGACATGLAPVSSPALLPLKYCTANQYLGDEATRRRVTNISGCEQLCSTTAGCGAYTVGRNTPHDTSNTQSSKCFQAWTEPGHPGVVGGRAPSPPTPHPSTCGGCSPVAEDCSGGSLHTAKQSPPANDNSNKFGYNPVVRVMRAGLCPNCTVPIRGVCRPGGLGGDPSGQSAGPAFGLRMLRSSAAECCALCSATAGCYAWTWADYDYYQNPPQKLPGPQRMCYLKAGCGEPSVDPQHKDDQAVSGWVVQCVGAPAPHARPIKGYAGDVCTSPPPSGQGGAWCPKELQTSVTFPARECMPGFWSTGGGEPVQYKCVDRDKDRQGTSYDGQWQPADPQKPLVCFRCAGAPASNTQPCDGSSRSCTAKCLQGFDYANRGAQPYTCNPDSSAPGGGTWTPASESAKIVCVPIGCGNTLPVKHSEQTRCSGQPHVALADANGHVTPASTCNVTCDPGYKPKDPQRPGAQRTYTCMEEGDAIGHWQGGGEAYQCVSDCPVGHEVVHGAHPMSGTVNCTRCPEGHFANGAEPCKACSELYNNRVTSKDQGSCVQCDIGEGANELQSGCEQCPEGKKSSTKVGGCEECGVLGSSDDRSRCGSTPRIGAAAVVLALVLLVPLCVCCRKRQTPSSCSTACIAVNGVICAWIATVIALYLLSDATHLGISDVDGPADVACVVATYGSLLAIWLVVRNYQLSTVDKASRQRPIKLAEGKGHLGVVGVCQFLWGAYDLVVDIVLCVSLAICGRWALFMCAATSLVATSLLTAYLSHRTICVIRDTNEEARRWVSQHRPWITCVRLLSLSRLDSLAILRSKIFGRWISRMPMGCNAGSSSCAEDEDHRFFHFIRHAGASCVPLFLSLLGRSGCRPLGTATQSPRHGDPITAHATSFGQNGVVE